MTRLQNLDLKGKKVLLRLDLNVTSRIPEEIAKEERIQNALPIIRYIRERGGIAIPMSHLKRPGGKPSPKYSLAPVAKALSSEMGIDVKMAPDCIGSEVEKIIADAQPGDVVLLENLRFHPGEKTNDPEFVEQLARLGDVYINDAFGTAHRKDGSIYGLALKFDVQNKAPGLLIEKEIKTWTEAIESVGPKYLVLGGKKLKEKIGALETLSKKFKKIYVGGPVYNVIRAAQKRSVGKSLIKEKDDDTDYVKKTQGFLDSLENLVLPDQLVIAKMVKKQQGDKQVVKYLDERTIAETDEVPDDYMIIDCIYDPKKLSVIEEANPAIAFGPLGIFEDSRFAEGCNSMAKALNKAKKAILGGGESGPAYKLATKAFVSTGGGASIKFYQTKLKGKELPAIKALKAA